MAESKSTEPLNSTKVKAEVPPPQDPLAKPPIPSHKRKLGDNGDPRYSSYFKIRALVRQLRPQFIQILQTPDFRNCKAAHEIKLQLKLLADLYKQMISEGPSAGKNVLGTHYFGGHQEGKQSGLLQPQLSLDESLEKKPRTTPFSSDKKLDDIGEPRESYIVGGSAFGWNFITFSGSKPVYYGVSTESYRRSRKMTDQSVPNRCSR